MVRKQDSENITFPLICSVAWGTERGPGGGKETSQVGE